MKKKENASQRHTYILLQNITISVRLRIHLFSFFFFTISAFYFPFSDFVSISFGIYSFTKTNFFCPFEIFIKRNIQISLHQDFRCRDFHHLQHSRANSSLFVCETLCSIFSLPWPEKVVPYVIPMTTCSSWSFKSLVTSKIHIHTTLSHLFLYKSWEATRRRIILGIISGNLIGKSYV